MPSPSQPTETTNEEQVAPSYPALEAFVESASREEAALLFAPLKEKLDALPALRAEQAKKVHAALAQVEELLGVLLDTRERLAADLKGPK